MAKGVLITESLRAGSKLAGFPLTLVSLERQEFAAQDEGGEAQVRSILEFEVPDAQAQGLADALVEAVDSPGWYVDFRTDEMVYLVFPGKVFAYQPGDTAGRAEAVAYARSVGVCEADLDWGEG